MTPQPYQPTTDAGRTVKNLLALHDDADTLLHEGAYSAHAKCFHHGALELATIFNADALGEVKAIVAKIHAAQESHHTSIELLKAENRSEARRWGALSAVAVSVVGTVLANALMYWMLLKK